MDTDEVLQKKSAGSRRRWANTQRLCRFCGKESGTKTICPACYPDYRRQYQARYMQNRRTIAREEKRCTQCNDLLPDRKGNVRYCDRCRSLQNARHDKYGLSGFCRACGSRPRFEHRVTCEPCTRSRAKNRVQRKLDVLLAYGGVCACCGEQDWRMLTLDHILNDGAEERRVLSPDGTNKSYNFYGYLKRNGYPQGPYQVLCWNCNMSKAHFGSCAHTTDTYPFSANEYREALSQP